MDLPTEIEAWVQQVVQGKVVDATRHHAGASRIAWSVDVDVEGKPEHQRLFLLKDKGEGRGSQRDAAVLRALAETEVPVPAVLGLCDRPSMILLERLPGRSDFPSVDREDEREPTAQHLMELTALLHGLDARAMEIPHLKWPETAGESTQATLEQMKGALSALGDSANPFFGFAISWLQENRPNGATQTSLIHSDMGPGNFLFEGGRVTGIVDWEVAHYGDPMEDLAAIAVRDMATPIGDLVTRFREYGAASGIEVNLDRVDYFRALVLTRNSLMIGLGLAFPPEGFDVAEMTMYQTLLMRGASLVLCDNLGVERPAPIPQEEEEEKLRSPIPAALSAEGAALLYAQRMHCLAEERRELMGEMMDRMPQRLEKK